MNRQSITVRLTLSIMATSAVIFLTAVLVIYFFAQQIITNDVQQTSIQEITSIANDLGGYFGRILQIPSSVAAIDTSILRESDHDERINTILKNLLAKSPDILNGYVAYEKFKVSEKEYDISAWMWDGTGKIVRQPLNIPGDVSFDPSKPVYDYQNNGSWYLLADRAARPVWGPPHNDAGGSNQLVVSAAAPIYDGAGFFIGVAGNNVTLTYMANEISKVRLAKTGYAFVIAPDGKFITFPEEGWVLDKSIFDMAENQKNTGLAKVGEDLAQNMGGLVEVKNPLDQKSAWAVYTIIPSTGWGLVGILPQAEALEEVTKIQTIMLVMAALGVFILGLLSFWVARGTGLQLKKLSQVASRVATGDLTSESVAGTISQTKSTHNEIDQITAAFGDVIEYLKCMSDAANHIAAGDLTVTVKCSSEKDFLGIAFSRMVINLRGLVGEVIANAASLGAASEQLNSAAVQSAMAISQIAGNAQQVATRTSQQNETITHTTNSVEQMNRTIDGVAQGAQHQAREVSKASEVTAQIARAVRQVTAAAQESAVGASQAAGTSRSGAIVLQDTMRGMSAIKDRVGFSAQKIKEMGQHSEKIGDIVEKIEEIASQTNLLALNAAIETARAESQAEIMTDVILEHQMITQAHLLNQILLEKRGQFTPSFWEELAKRSHIDSLCITDADGVIVYTNEATLIDWRFPDDPKSQAHGFRKLIGQKDGIVCQKPQRRSSDNRVFKYVGISRLDEPGIVQVACDADSIKKYKMNLASFAVVAEEVRKLADRAAAATKEIDVMIKDIQKITDEAKKAMDDGAKEVERGVERTYKSESALSNILAGIETVKHQVETIAAAAQQMNGLSNDLVGAMDAVSAVVEENTAATEEMAAGSAEVTQAIERIARVSEENSAAIEEVSGSTEEMSAQVEEVTGSAQNLAEMARGLQGLVRRFKLEEQAAEPAAELEPVAEAVPAKDVETIAEVNPEAEVGPGVNAGGQ